MQRGSMAFCFLVVSQCIGCFTYAHVRPDDLGKLGDYESRRETVQLSDLEGKRILVNRNTSIIVGVGDHERQFLHPVNVVERVPGRFEITSSNQPPVNLSATRVTSLRVRRFSGGKTALAIIIPVAAVAIASLVYILGSEEPETSTSTGGSGM